MGYSSFPAPGCAPQRAHPELALLYAWKEPSKRAAPGPEGLPRLAAGELNIYVLATKSQCGVTVSTSCLTGERSCLAVAEEGGQEGMGWGMWEGSTDPSLGTGGVPRLAARHGMAGNPEARPYTFSISWPRYKGLGRGRGSQPPGLSALFPAIYQAPFPGLISLIRSFVPATALKRICGRSDSIPLLQGCLSLGDCGDLASLSPDWALSALPRVLPGLRWDEWGTAQPFAETRLQLRLFC